MRPPNDAYCRQQAHNFLAVPAYALDTIALAPFQQSRRSRRGEALTRPLPARPRRTLQAEIRQIGRIARWQRGTLVGSGSYGKVRTAWSGG